MCNSKWLSRPELEIYARALLDCSSTGYAKQLIDPVLQRLCQQIGLDLHPAIFVDTHATITAYGKAVSPTTAAQCAEDPDRGRVFIQGLFQAIVDQLQQDPNRPVKLLYAGTGPLGWLVLPLLTVFDASQLQVTALDIHPQSLQSFKTLTEYFAVADRISEWVCADATLWHPEPRPTFDLILSETMKHLLQQEPQVEIFSHLQQFLSAKGQLIPQQIKLDAWLEWREHDKPQLHYLGPLFTLNKQLCGELAVGNLSGLSGQWPLPDFEPRPVDLKLTTDIQVYGTHWLRENQSQLTIPRYKSGLMLVPGSVVQFQYQQGTYPDFDFHYQQQWPELVDSDDHSCAGVVHAKRLWQKIQLKRLRKLDQDYSNEWLLDKAVLDLCGVGLEPGIQALYRCHRLSEFAAFLQPYVADPSVRLQINQQLKSLSQAKMPTAIPQVLTEAQLEFWRTQGYLVIPAVLSKEQCQQSCKVIWQYLQADPAQPESWYQSTEKMQKIMLQLFRDPVLDANRQQPLIRQVYEQLWQRTDLVMTTDRVSFNPPETKSWSFPGPDMHWDVMLKSPVPFGTQGLIYLTDTTEQQGAFCCVPGFHLQIDHWINSQNKTEFEMQQQDWSAWPVKAIAAKAGDLIIWHQALPHGASVNRAAKPRMVQYVNTYPLQ
ncbi:phytanoyl-CoA dioxygenase [Rheinheimera sp. EpRS3]|nr:phytanoyl-CoA dioxygenase [Rheinheimera sp. EpRS3]